MIRRALGFTLLLLAAGCGNVETGGVSTQPTSTPAPGDDDDDDGSSTPQPYDPGPAPSEAGGMAVFARNRTQDANDFVGMVNFFPIAVPLPPAFADAWNGFPDHAMDTCKEIYPSSVSLSTNVEPPDAGHLELAGPNGSIGMDPFMGMYLSIWNPGEIYVPVSDYTLTASGGEIPPFQQTIRSAGDIPSLNPDIIAVRPFVVSRAQPLSLKWESVPDGGPIYIFFEQQDQPEWLRSTWMCKALDDGDFEVPLAVLQFFGPTVEPFPTEDWRDKLSLRRWRYGAFTPPGAAGPILTAMESGWYADIRFE